MDLFRFANKNVIIAVLFLIQKLGALVFCLKIYEEISINIRVMIKAFSIPW